MTENQVALQSLAFFRRNPDLAEIAEPGGDAVNRLGRVQQLIDDSAAGGQLLPAGRADFHRFPLSGHPNDFIQRQRVSVNTYHIFTLSPRKIPPVALTPKGFPPLKIQSAARDADAPRS